MLRHYQARTRITLAEVHIHVFLLLITLPYISLYRYVLHPSGYILFVSSMLPFHLSRINFLLVDNVVLSCIYMCNSYFYGLLLSTMGQVEIVFEIWSHRCHYYFFKSAHVGSTLHFFKAPKKQGTTVTVVNLLLHGLSIYVLKAPSNEGQQQHALRATEMARV